MYYNPEHVSSFFSSKKANIYSFASILERLPVGFLQNEFNLNPSQNRTFDTIRGFTVRSGILEFETNTKELLEGDSIKGVYPLGINDVSLYNHLNKLQESGIVEYQKVRRGQHTNIIIKINPLKIIDKFIEKFPLDRPVFPYIDKTVHMALRLIENLKEFINKTYKKGKTRIMNYLDRVIELNKYKTREEEIRIAEQEGFFTKSGRPSPGRLLLYWEDTVRKKFNVEDYAEKTTRKNKGKAQHLLKTLRQKGMTEQDTKKFINQIFESWEYMRSDGLKFYSETYKKDIPPPKIPYFGFVHCHFEKILQYFIINIEKRKPDMQPIQKDQSVEQFKTKKYF